MRHRVIRRCTAVWTTRQPSAARRARGPQEALLLHRVVTQPPVDGYSPADLRERGCPQFPPHLLRLLNDRYPSPRQHLSAPRPGDDARRHDQATSPPWHVRPLHRPRIAHAPDHRRRPPVKFRVERDVLADAVAWAARSLPVRPQRARARGPADRDGRGRRRPAALDVRLRDLGPGDPAGRRCRTRAARWSPAGCWPTSAAACPNKPVEMAIDGAKVVADLRLRPVHACRPCRSRSTRRCRTMPRGHRHGAQRRCSPTRSPRRSPPPAATTCCRC